MIGSRYPQQNSRDLKSANKRATTKAGPTFKFDPFAPTRLKPEKPNRNRTQLTKKIPAEPMQPGRFS